MSPTASSEPLRKAHPAPTRSFRTRLRKARTSLGWSQADLAAAAGLQQSALSHYENGVRRPSFTNLRRLASALGVSTDFLVGHTSPAAARALELANQIERLRPADRERVRSLVASLVRESE